MANTLFILPVLMLLYTAESCDLPTDLKATVVNGYKDIKITWNKPTSGPEVVNFVIYINNWPAIITGTTYLIQNAQHQMYKFLIRSVCRYAGYSNRIALDIGFVGEAVYGTIDQQSVKITWRTSATKNDTIDIWNKEQNIILISLEKGNVSLVDETRFKDRIIYTGELATYRISFTLSDVTKLDAGYYSTRVGTTDTGGRVLVVLDKPTKPTTLYNNSYVGKPLELTCNSQKTSKPDYYTPELNYTWFENRSVLSNNTGHLGRYSQVQNRLIINNITRQDKDKKFFCKASDRGQQSEQSETITLDPLYGPEIVILTPDIKVNVVKVGEKVGPISCSAECNPYCTFTWSFRKTGNTSPRKEITRSNILTVENVTVEDIGQYRCEVISSDSNTLPQANWLEFDLVVQCQPMTKLVTSSLTGSYVINVLLAIVVVVLTVTIVILFIRRKRLEEAPSSVNADLVSGENTNLKMIHTPTSRVKTDMFSRENTKPQIAQKRIENVEDLNTEVTEPEDSVRTTENLKRDCEAACGTGMDEDGYLTATDIDIKEHSFQSLRRKSDKKFEQTGPYQDVHGYIIFNVENRDVSD